jgi:hypothetical protein
MGAHESVEGSYRLPSVEPESPHTIAREPVQTNDSPPFLGAGAA